MKKRRFLISSVVTTSRRKWLRGSFACVLFAAILALIVSCDELLPPYIPPGLLFVGSFYPRYVRSKQGEQLQVLLTVKNVFDEALQDTADLKGSFEIILARDPSIRKTVTIGQQSLLYHYNTILGYPFYANHPSIDPYGILTVNSGDSVSFYYPWNFISDDSVDLTQSVFNLTLDPQHPGHYIAAPETLIFRGSVQMFSRIGLVDFKTLKYLLRYDTQR